MGKTIILSTKNGEAFTSIWKELLIMVILMDKVFQEMLKLILMITFQIKEQSPILMVFKILHLLTLMLINLIYFVSSLDNFWIMIFQILTQVKTMMPIISQLLLKMELSTKHDLLELKFLLELQIQALIVIS